MDATNDETVIAEAVAWAAKRNRQLDAELLATALDLRAAYDDRSAGSWPPGSAQDLVLVRWPAHGPTHGPAVVPDPDLLAQTLESFWRFLRGTGRMTMASAEPAALVKELRRALPQMAQACADRSRWSHGRVLGDFGASIGIDLSRSEGVEDAQAKLDEIMARWNALPMDERRRLMPDPSPKTAGGMAITDALAAAMRDGAYGGDPGLAFDEESGFGGLETTRGDPGAAARQARESPFVNACLELARWVGRRREVTSIGVLRPAVAREAYRELKLPEWELAHGRIGTAFEDARSPGVLEVFADRSAPAFTTALDCRPLHRLWGPAVAAGLIEVRATVASGHAPEPATDDEWRKLAGFLFVGLAGALHPDSVEALLITFDALAERRDGEAPLAAIQQRWLDDTGRGQPLAHMNAQHHQVLRDASLWPLTEALRSFDDTGVWTRGDGWLAITELGREFAWVLTGCISSGMFDELFLPSHPPE